MSIDSIGWTNALFKIFRPMSDRQKVAVVTGANRGLGFEACRQLARQGFKVVLTSRDRSKGQTAAETLQAEGLDVIAQVLDVTSPESIEQLRQFLQEEFGRIDVLINNAGIYPESGSSQDGSVLSVGIDTMRTAMETNVYAPLQLSQTLIGLMDGSGRIVNVSSGMGQLSEMGGGSPAYRVSKTALNAVTTILAAELKGTNILVNAMCPGWVKTDMGGMNAPRTPEQGAETMVWLAMLPDGSPTGGFFRDKQPIAW